MELSLHFCGTDAETKDPERVLLFVELENKGFFPYRDPSILISLTVERERVCRSLDSLQDVSSVPPGCVV